MNKCLLFLCCLYTIGMSGYTIEYENKINNSKPVEFFTHTSTALCCYGTGEGKCSTVVQSQGKGTYQFPTRCGASCITSITAKINYQDKIVLTSLDLQSKSALEALDNMGAGLEAVLKVQPTIGYGYNSKEQGAAALGVIIVGGVVGGTVSAYKAIKYQCTNMKITLLQTGPGDKPDHYSFKYEKK